MRAHRGNPRATQESARLLGLHGGRAYRHRFSPFLLAKYPRSLPSLGKKSSPLEVSSGSGEGVVTARNNNARAPVHLGACGIGWFMPIYNSLLRTTGVFCTIDPLFHNIAKTVVHAINLGYGQALAKHPPRVPSAVVGLL